MKRAGIAVLLAGALVSSASLANRQKALSSRDAVWVRAFADDCSSPTSDCDGGRENDLMWDPRFHVLVETSLHQRQWFWYDHGRLVSLSDLVQQFLGIPGSALMDDHRYISIDGCVPHDCVADRGMLWIDTGVQPAQLIFSALNLVGGEPEPGTGDESHMWVFSSSRLNWQKLPLNYSASVKRWLDSNTAQGYKERIVMVTLVDPNGVMEDVTLPSLYFNQNYSEKQK